MLQQEGVDQVFLDARQTALSFYLRAGFITEGSPFIRKGLMYIRMINQLQGTAASV